MEEELIDFENQEEPQTKKGTKIIIAVLGILGILFTIPIALNPIMMIRSEYSLSPVHLAMFFIAAFLLVGAIFVLLRKQPGWSMYITFCFFVCSLMTANYIRLHIESPMINGMDRFEETYVISLTVFSAVIIYLFTTSVRKLFKVSRTNLISSISIGILTGVLFHFLINNLSP